MIDIVLAVIYFLLLVFHVTMLIACIRKPAPKKWLIHISSQAVTALCALFMGMYYDSLAGAGMMPGLTYFAEALYSFVAFLVFGSVLVVSLVTFLIKKFMP